MIRSNLSAASVVKLTVIGLLIACGSGCSSEYPTPVNPLAPVEAQFEVPPKQMVEIARKTISDPPLSLAVEDKGKGVLLTGYQPFPGEWHILRRWQEQTRYKISVFPDWDEPTQRCLVQVVDETQTRATNGQTWDTAPEIGRRERSQQIMDRLKEAAQKK